MPFGGEGGPWMLKSVSCVWLSVSLWTVACQVPLSMGFSRQEYWSGLPFFFSRGFSPPRDWTCTSCVSYVAGRFFTYWATREAPKEAQFSHSVVCGSLRPHRLQHARPPGPSPTPGAYLNSCPLSWPCHPTISSSVVPFSSCPQSFPASGSFQMSQLFKSGGAKVLEFQLQHQPFQWTLRVDIL